MKSAFALGLLFVSTTVNASVLQHSTCNLFFDNRVYAEMYGGPYVARGYNVYGLDDAQIPTAGDYLGLDYQEDFKPVLPRIFGVNRKYTYLENFGRDGKKSNLGIISGAQCRARYGWSDTYSSFMYLTSQCREKALPQYSIPTCVVKP